MSTWNNDDTNFLIKNWANMNNRTLGKKMKRTPKTISIKAARLNLPKKHSGPGHRPVIEALGYVECKTKNDGNISTKAYHQYKAAMIVQNKLIEFKKVFNIEVGWLKVVVDDNIMQGRHSVIKRIVEGKVIQVTPYLVTMQLDKYRENFETSQFFTGEVAII